MRDDYLTVGELRKVLGKLSPDTPVYYHRIEDVYFEKHNWKADLLVPDEYAPEIPELRDEYIRAFAAYRHKDEDGKMHICITAHY